MGYCKGITKKGERCKKKVIQNDYCSLHKVKHIQILNDECSICMENIMNVDYSLLLIGDCKHAMHKDGCAEGMQDSKCPLCRAEIKELEGRKIKPEEMTEMDQELIQELVENTREAVDAFLSMFIEMGGHIHFVEVQISEISDDDTVSLEELDN